MSELPLRRGYGEQENSDPLKGIYVKDSPEIQKGRKFGATREEGFLARERLGMTIEVRVNFKNPTRNYGAWGTRRESEGRHAANER
jgi:hypothetical protein